MTDANKMELFHRKETVEVLPKDDARITDLENVLGWPIADSAITDLGEIKIRQEVFAYLLDNIDYLNELFYRWESVGGIYIPENNSVTFLSYSQQLPSKRTVFWLWVEKLLQGLPANMPKQLEQAVEVISQEKDDYFQEENDLAEAIVEELTRSVIIEGILKLKVGWPGLDSREVSWSEQVCCGVNLYTPIDERNYQEYKMPKWTGSIGRHYAKRVNDKRQKQLQKSPKINSIPAPIFQDIRNYFAKWFENNSSNYLGFSEVTLKIYYCYNQAGLKVKVLDWDYSTSSDHIGENKRDIPTLDFHDLEDANARESINKIIIQVLQQRARESKHRELRSKLIYSHNNLCSINDENTRAHYCANEFPEVMAKYGDHLKLVNKWHEKVYNLFQELYGYYSVISTMKRIAVLNKLPLEMPDEVSNQGNVLEVSQFAPVRLCNARRIKPFSQFSVNGKMLNLTGRNGSGKSTLLLTVLDLCLMAQCGLPVFAQKVRLSVKKYFLLSFLERVSDDSTFKAKLRKDMSVITTIKRLESEDRKDVLAIVDELGSATTQESVISVIKPFADWLSKTGVSAILSTQIPEFSHYMADNLNVKNFKINSDFAVEEGIGEGEPEAVAKEMGFFELLND